MRPARVPPGILPVAAVLGVFVAGSVAFTALEDPGEQLHIIRPFYALFDPGFSVVGLLSLVVGGAIVWLAWRRRSALPAGARPVLALPVLVLAMGAFAATIAAIDGARGFTEPIQRTAIPDSYADADLVARYGVRGISGSWDLAVASAESIHTASHPPGALLLIHGVRQVVGGPWGLVAVQGLSSVLVLVPAWVIARAVAGARASLVAVLLLAVAPAPVLHVFTSMDAVYATLLAAGIALIVLAVRAGARPRFAVVAGAVIGLTTFMTYAAVFVAVFGVLHGVWTRGRAALRPLGLAAVGGVGALAILWLALDFNVFTVYAASRDRLHAFPSGRSYWYGLVAAPVAWLVFAGVPMAGLAVREVLARRPPYLLAMLAPLAVFYVLPWSLTGIIPLETERTLQFAYPLAAAAAGAAYVRWEGARGSASDATLAVLVGATAAQTILLEALFFLFW